MLRTRDFLATGKLLNKFKWKFWKEKDLQRDLQLRLMTKEREDLKILRMNVKHKTKKAKKRAQFYSRKRVAAKVFDFGILFMA
jgi:hypothetical protein